MTSHVTLEVFDLRGENVSTLVNEERAAGVYRVTWKAAYSSGTYFYRLVAVSSHDPTRRFTETRKMVVVK